MAATMNAQLIAYTVFEPPVDEDDLWIFEPDGLTSLGYGTYTGSALAEFAGRVCYQSFDRPNPATATNDGYLLNILRQKHGSVLEHATVSFYVTGISRTLSHEFVRHRMFSYSQLSQRYVDSSDVEVVLPPAVLQFPALVNGMDKLGDQLTHSYDAVERVLTENGLGRKKAREAARAVLAGMTETRMVVTGNYRAWIDFLIKRDNPAADAEIQALARSIGTQLAAHAPNVFGPTARAEWDETARQAPAREVAAA
jgi:thymidylate synthase (FAD)